jgi:hypothetical protein
LSKGGKLSMTMTRHPELVEGRQAQALPLRDAFVGQVEIVLNAAKDLRRESRPTSRSRSISRRSASSASCWSLWSKATSVRRRAVEMAGEVRDAVLVLAEDPPLDFPLLGGIESRFELTQPRDPGA